MTGPDVTDVTDVTGWPAPRLPPATVVPAAPRLDPRPAAGRGCGALLAAVAGAGTSGRGFRQARNRRASAVSVALTAGAGPAAEGAAAVVPGMSASAAADCAVVR